MLGPFDGALGVPAAGHPLCRIVPCFVHSGPFDGAPGVPAAGHPLCRFITCSIHLGWHYPGWWVLPLNPKLLQANDNCGGILDMVVVSCDVVGTSCEELGSM
jgi:hypothetical protein